LQTVCHPQTEVTLPVHWQLHRCNQHQLYKE